VGLLPPVRLQEAPVFAPSKRFTGQRHGCVFTNGAQGLGYYRDQWPAVLMTAPRLSKAAEKSKPCKAAKQEQRGRGGGILGASKAQLDATQMSSDDEGEAEDEGAGIRKAKRQKRTSGRKALPGRLRKKLAKEAAAEH
jgi:hypothetical protein